MQEEFLREVLFPFSKVRDVQIDMIKDVYSALKNKKSMILHAPTGIGKTVSVLAPSLAHAIKNELNVFFLTSRQTQHRIAVETLKEIKNIHGTEFGVTDIIGKRGMCIQPGISAMPTGDFHEFCKSLREEEKCEFYTNARNKNNTPSVKAKVALDAISKSGPMHVGGFIEIGEKEKLCPYELALMNAAESKVIIADYSYIFNDYIRDSFILKAKKEIEKSIIIVDEGHNLPARMRDMMTSRLTSFMIEMALKEAKKMEYSESVQNIQIVNNALLALADKIKEEDDMLVEKNDFIRLVSSSKEFETLADELVFIGEQIRDTKKTSFVLGIAKFLENWPNGEEGFARIVSKGKYITISVRCLDPSIATKEVVGKSYSTILMSGTLTPTSMYKDVLGFPPDTSEKEYGSPFPNHNRIVCVMPKTTTKYTKRSEEQFRQIAKNCAEITNKADRCSIIFFPSYSIMNIVREHFMSITNKTVFTEKQKLTKEEKEEFLLNFKSHKEKGAVLLAVSSGSFGEGIDLPGILSCVVVAGLPLQKPDLEIKQLIKYYDRKFGNGWDYGYVMPAITKCMQNAGRCIRSETDKGAIIFLDERYAWPQYFRCFPKGWEVEIMGEISNRLKDFFENR